MDICGQGIKARMRYQHTWKQSIVVSFMSGLSLDGYFITKIDQRCEMYMDAINSGYLSSRVYLWVVIPVAIAICGGAQEGIVLVRKVIIDMALVFARCTKQH